MPLGFVCCPDSGPFSPSTATAVGTNCWSSGQPQLVLRALNCEQIIVYMAVSVCTVVVKSENFGLRARTKKIPMVFVFVSTTNCKNYAPPNETENNTMRRFLVAVLALCLCLAPLATGQSLLEIIEAKEEVRLCG